MLSRHHAILVRRYSLLSNFFDTHYRHLPNFGHGRMHRLHALEGLISNAWQTWNGFCRGVIFDSCNGTTSMDGRAIAPHIDCPTIGRIGYVAKQVHHNRPIRANGTVQPHSEPTWGDPSIILGAVEHYLPANADSLRLGLQLAYDTPEHMRHVRNAAAHLSKANVNRVRGVSLYYMGPSFKHPLDLLYWQTKDTNEPAFQVWLSDLSDMAFEMCR